MLPKSIVTSEAFLKQTEYPIDHPIDRAGKVAKEKHRACHGEDLCAHAQDCAFASAIDGGGGDGVGEARDGNEGACSRVLGYLIKDPKPRKEHGGKDKRDRHQEPHVFLWQGQKF